ncbi:hypothetical protein EK21DRAFT_72727 [Setomelanomma holmii]|uniref:Uncharacterized protein n=1 Tax=Setomelanomma holmii TaxID=210430 RepID=A0A9P4LJC2_9PLEO|nr:hypothetical protein EK21DRAFT_72727 [Setomelanomma holmii]
MGTHDSQTVKSEADILARQSRPQRNSTWIPKTRDWRYATGVIQHDDFEDAPKARSVWDTMDFDFQGQTIGSTQEGVRSSSGLKSDTGTDEVAGAAHTPKCTASVGMSRSPAAETQKKIGYKPMTMRKYAWAQVATYTRKEKADADTGESQYSIKGLTVRLHFTGKNKAQLQEILWQPAQPAMTVHTPHVLDSIESLYTFPLYQRDWVDETYTTNLKDVRSTLRDPKAKDVKELGDNYGWYFGATPIDAIFPSGIPLSAKEICAFYPHHVRWKGVMLRFTNNDYRGADIMGMQRDTVKTSIPGFKTGSHKGKSDRNLRTDQLDMGPHIKAMRKGFTLPTFQDLLRGLQKLPAGLDARDLTQCLAWYIGICESFTPKLDLNVLHTQSLVRALRQPLKPFGPQNLDRNALEEWRSKGCFDDFKIEHKQRHPHQTNCTTDSLPRSQLHLNLDTEEILLNHTFPIRHMLTFPFVALHRVVSEALKLGIEKAELRQASRQQEVAKSKLEAKWAARRSSSAEVEMADEESQVKEEPADVPSAPAVPDPNKPYRMPKCPHLEEPDLQPPRGTKIPAGPRMLAPAPPRQHSSHPQHGGPSSRPWSVPALPWAENLRPSEQDAIYGRQNQATRPPDPRRDVTSQRPRQHGFDVDGKRYDVYGRRW